MLSRIHPWGNSQGIRLSKSLLEAAHLNPKEPIEITAIEGRIIIEPVSKIRGKYNLETLLKNMPDNNKTSEEPWGPPQGKEIW